MKLTPILMLLRLLTRSQLYKLVARQVAQQMDMTASFLPKPVTGVNGSGMHTNMSISKGDTNLFYQADGQDGISGFAWDFVKRILTAGSVAWF